MKVIVTGANGLVGQHLVKRLLEDGHKVTALIRKTSKKGLLNKLKGLKFAYGDIRDAKTLEKAIQGQEIIFHLAAIVHLPYKEKKTYYDVNVKGTKNILNACSKNKALQKLIHCSSVGCYAPTKEEIHEDSPCHSQSLYGKSKYEAEKVIKAFVKEYPLPHVMVRPARVYGPGDLTLLPLFKQVKKGLFIKIGKMKTTMMPIHVDDMAEAFIQCMELPIKNGETYNIAGPHIVTTKKFMETIAKVMQKKIPNISIPMPFIKTIAILIERTFGIINKKPPISLKKLRFFTNSERYSTKKAKTELGFTARINIEEGLEELYHWYKEHNYL